MKDSNWTRRRFIEAAAASAVAALTAGYGEDADEAKTLDPPTARTPCDNEFCRYNEEKTCTASFDC